MPLRYRLLPSLLLLVSLLGCLPVWAQPAVKQKMASPSVPGIWPREAPSSPGTVRLLDDFAVLHPTRWRFTRPTGQYSKTITRQIDYKPPAQVRVENGKLLITADRAEIQAVNDYGMPHTYHYKSGWVQTWNSLAFRYGTIRIRFKPALGKGLISSAYLLPQNDLITFKEKWPPEIDIFETDGGVGRKGIPGSDTYFTLHFADASQEHQRRMRRHTTNGDWRIVEVRWTPDAVEWWQDGVMQHRVTEGVPDEPMYLVLELCVGTWIAMPDETTPLPSTLQVDFVEINTQPGSGGFLSR
ncbi:MAG: family 16 glycosylhydrolase [Candidatus Melainabacteria bacterium]